MVARDLTKVKIAEVLRDEIDEIEKTNVQEIMDIKQHPYRGTEDYFLAKRFFRRSRSSEGKKSLQVLS